VDDLRNAIRTLRATPIVTLVVVISLTLGIGGNTAIFSIANSLLLRALPVEQPDRLVLLLSNPSVNPGSPWSNPVWEQIRDRHADLFDTVFAFSRRTTRFNLAQGGRTDFVDGVYASGQYFDALRVAALLGRTFTAEDDRRGGGSRGPVAVVSYAFWQRRFGGAADVIGRTQTIDRVPFTIIAVMPPDFFGTDVDSRSDVIAEWFATYGTRIVAGRDFDARDGRAAPPVAIVNETFARRFLPGGDPVGRRIRNPPPVPSEMRPWLEVVGIVADSTYLALRDAVPPTMYLPQAQQDTTGPSPLVTLSVRAVNGPPALLARELGDAIARVDPDIAITFTKLKVQVDAALVQERIMAILSGSFGALALLLSTLGLYGVTAYAVNRRRMEIGIRMAIGAAPATVVRLVLARVVILVGAGVLIGAGTSVWASNLVAALLFGVEPRDPVTVIGAALLLASVAAVAGWVPAWRASRIDPAEVLRES
jgi:hypothetical protein